MDAVHPVDRRIVETWAGTVDGTVLDAGCGPGHWTAHLASRGVDVRGADLEIWTALAAPAGMNKTALARLNAALVEVISTDEVREALLKTGWQAQPGSPDALARRMRADTARLGGVILMKGIHAEG